MPFISAKAQGDEGSSNAWGESEGCSPRIDAWPEFLYLPCFRSSFPSEGERANNLFEPQGLSPGAGVMVKDEWVLLSPTARK
jgi:hypothetical protein